MMTSREKEGTPVGRVFDHNTTLPLFIHIPKAAGTTLSICIYLEYRAGLTVKEKVNLYVIGFTAIR
jgi:hypothetical protein